MESALLKKKVGFTIFRNGNTRFSAAFVDGIQQREPVKTSFSDGWLQ